MRVLLFLLAGIGLGAASWALSGAVSGKFEPFDNATGFFLCQTVLGVSALTVGMRAGLLRALLCLAGAWIGMNAYAYAFGSSEMRAWIVLLLFSSLTLLMIPLAAAIVGGCVRAIRARRSMQGPRPG